MYASQERKLIYLAHPRTASLATAELLLSMGFEMIKGKNSHHSTLFEEGSPVTEENRHEWKVFTAVRNPWDVAVSWCLRGMHPIRQPKTPWSPDIFKAGLITDWVKENALFWLHLADADLSAVLGEPVKVPEHNVTPGRN